MNPHVTNELYETALQLIAAMILPGPDNEDLLSCLETILNPSEEDISTGLLQLCLDEANACIAEGYFSMQRLITSYEDIIPEDTQPV